MAKYDVFQQSDSKNYLLDVQSNLLDGLNTRVVVPLMPMSKAPKPADRLNPVFQINSKDHVMVTQFLSAVPITMLTKSICNIDQNQEQITAAIDMLTHGF